MNKIVRKVTSTALLCSMLAYTVPVFAYTKEESVYSKLDSNGNIYQTTVSNHLKNTNKEEYLKDISDLMNIENVSGDQKLDIDGNNLTWKADGNDIYYNGKTEKELPISCKITYELDGKEVSKEDIVGKSGSVKVKLNFVNKESRNVIINGKRETMYVPFVVACGTIIDNENNKNINVNSGKTIDDGTKTMVFGLAMPGMQESLNISKDKVEIPSSVEISMNAKDFEMKSIYIYASPKIIEEKDLDIFNKLDALYSKMNLLQNSANQLEEGTNTLKEGTATYYEKSQEFGSAIGQITSGINSASSNYTKINDGINLLNENTTVLATGAKTVSDGTNLISTNLVSLNENVGLLKNGANQLVQGETKLSAGLDQIISGVSQIQVTDNSEKINQLKTLVNTNTTTIGKLESANNSLETTKQTLTAQKNQLVESLQNASEEQKTIINTQIAAINTQLTTIGSQIESNKGLVILLKNNNIALNQTIATLQATDISSIKDLQDGLKALKTGVTELQTGTNALNTGLESLKNGTTILAEKSQELATGTKDLYQGSEKLKDGTNTLSNGSKQIKQGLNTLSIGGNQIKEVTGSLVDGAGTICKGTNTLAEGMNKFNKEGIQVLYNTINGEVKDVELRIKKLQELANEYSSFTMNNENVDSNVKFIMMVDSIKKEEKNKQDAIIPENNMEEKKEN